MKTRLSLIALVSLLTACVSHRPTPARYSLDAGPEPSPPSTKLNVTIAIPEFTAPSWLRSGALIYRLDYEAAPRPVPYTESEWQAPPGEMLTMRLRELVAQANGGFTLNRLDSASEGYQLDVALESFLQVFSQPHESHCIVQMMATLIGPRDRLVAQRVFNVELSAPSGNAAGGVRGLSQASNAGLEQIVTWVAATLQQG